jgi:hypothetical protein
MTSRQAMEEYNDGTIYRIHVQRGLSLTSNIIKVPVDIAQSELVGKVLIGLESMCLDRELYENNTVNLLNLASQQSNLRANWAAVQYLQLASVSLPPDIDYTTQEAYGTTPANGRNTQIFARVALPLDIIRRQDSNTNNFLNPRVAVNNNLGKNGILTEMTNNPNALGNGLLHIQLIDNNGKPWDLVNYPIRNLQFVIVIYKPRNTYN